MNQFSESKWSFTYSPKNVDVRIGDEERRIRLIWKMVAMAGMGYMCSHLFMSALQFFGFIP